MARPKKYGDRATHEVLVSEDNWVAAQAKAKSVGCSGISEMLEQIGVGLLEVAKVSGQYQAIVGCLERLVRLGLLPWVPYSRTNKGLPSHSGVYFVCTLQGDCLYVGCSKNLRTRFTRHQYLTDFKNLNAAKIYYFCVALDNCALIENALIDVMQPKLNKTGKRQPENITS